MASTLMIMPKLWPCWRRAWVVMMNDIDKDIERIKNKNARLKERLDWQKKRDARWREKIARLKYEINNKMDPSKTRIPDARVKLLN
jgi:predicted RNase H-like nuclease (RuvC/YqgF family)